MKIAKEEGEDSSGRTVPWSNGQFTAHSQARGQFQAGHACFLVQTFQLNHDI